MTSRKSGRATRHPPPGSVWRLQYVLQDKAHTAVRIRSKDYADGHKDAGEIHTPDRAVFDELAIRPFLHVEQLSRNGWFVQVCDRVFWVYVKRSGVARITYEEVRPDAKKNSHQGSEAPRARSRTPPGHTASVGTASAPTS